jgi:hypothetical protein
MVEQMEEALALGAPDIRAVAPSIPTLDSSVPPLAVANGCDLADEG